MPDIDTRHRLPADRKSTPDFRSVPALPNPTSPSREDTSPTILDKYTAQPEVASRHPDIGTKVATHLPHEPDIHRLTSAPDNSLPVRITGSRALSSVDEDPRPTMGNGVSGDQGNLPAHSKRDVREGIGAKPKRHDWSELARTREIVTSPPIPTSYISPVRPSARLSVCLSHGWISQRRLKLVCNSPQSSPI